MSSSRPRILAWSTWSASIVVAVVAAALLAAAWGTPDPPGAFGPPFLAHSMAIALGIVGLVIALRRPSNPIGWLVLGSSMVSAIQGLGTGYVRWTLLGGGDGPIDGAWGAWAEGWMWVPLVGALGVVAAIFPDGGFPSRRWGLVIRVLAAAIAVPCVLLAIGPTIDTYDVRNPIGVTGSAGAALTEAANISLLLLITLMGASTAAAFGRFRRARGEERQQLKWLVLAVAVLALGLGIFGVVAAFAGVGGSASPEDADWAENIIVVAFHAVPVSIGFGVLKYRLYDVDLVINRAVVYGALAVFISAVYVGVVVGVGALVGSGGNVLLSAVAAALVALAFQPARRRAQHLANRLVYGARATPYEVLSALSERFASTYSLDDALPRLVRVTGEAVGATHARVWLFREGELRPAAAWPDDAHAVSPVRVPADGDLEIPGDHVFAVRHAGTLLGAISVAMPPTEPITAPQEKLLGDVAAQAALVLRNVALIEDLRDSRKRIVTAQDERAKQLERNIHDGAQQQLVALGIQLRLARGLVAKDPERAVATLEDLEVRTRETLEDLRDLARGIYPPLLADEGLTAAVGGQARKSPVAVALDCDGVGRYPQDVESAVYFSVLEALQNVAKYSGAEAARVRIRHADGHLRFEVADTGAGFDPSTTSRGAGLQNMADRLAAIGGELHVSSSPGGGTVVGGSIPV